MVALPAFLAVTTPEDDTEATFSLLELQVSVYLALDGDTDAVNDLLCPIGTYSVELDSDTLEGLRYFTVTLQSFEYNPLEVLTYITVEPSAFPVTTPELLTEAILELAEYQDSVACALDGYKVAESEEVSPT